jgi:hypothetical protein
MPAPSSPPAPPAPDSWVVVKPQVVLSWCALLDPLLCHAMAKQ